MSIHLAIEERALNSWPALQTYVNQGWLYRFADGYTKRSNSINPLYASGGPWSAAAAEEAVARAERLYAGAGLDTIFKLTPFSQPVFLDELLERRGYEKVDPSAVLMRTLSDGLHLPEEPGTAGADAIKLETALSESWLKAAAELMQLGASAADTTRRMLGQSALPQCFVTVERAGRPAACGLGVVDGGYVSLYDIFTAPALRNQGLGERVVRAILDWGARTGAHASFLLVVQANAPALRLYAKLGYEMLYPYWYRVKNLT